MVQKTSITCIFFSYRGSGLGTLLEFCSLSLHRLLQAIHGETENSGDSNKNVVWTTAPLFCYFITWEFTHSNCKQENTEKRCVQQLPLLFKMSSSHFQLLLSIIRQKLNYSNLWGGKNISGTIFHVWFTEKAWDISLFFFTCIYHVAFPCVQIFVPPAGRFTIQIYLFTKFLNTFQTILLHNFLQEKEKYFKDA